MKRLGNCWNDICKLENVELAFDLAIKHKKHRDKHGKDKNEIVTRVHDSLVNETYDFGEYTKMTVYEPKEREIHYPKNFDTMVLHKCLINVVGKYFIKKLPDDSFASIKGRGLHKAVKKLKEFIKTHPDWYFFQGDISHYFQNIDHDKLKETLRWVLKCKKTLKFCDKLIDSYPTGLPIGNHTSPYFANLFLAKLGHRIKEELGAKLMIIYMDDILVCFKNKKEAVKFKAWFENELNILGLSLKSNFRIAPIKTGIDFLGYKFYDTHTKLRKRIKLRMKRKSNKMMSQPADKYKQQMASYWGWCKHGDCKHLLKKTMGSHLGLFTAPKQKKRKKKFNNNSNQKSSGSNNVNTTPTTP